MDAGTVVVREVTHVKLNGRDHNNLDYALLLGVVPRRGTPEIAAAVTEIMPQLGLRSNKARRETLAVVLANLYSAAQTLGHPFVGVPMTVADYAPGSRQAALWLTYRAVRDIVHALHEHGYIVLHPGTEASRRRTRIRATALLLKIFLHFRFEDVPLKLADDAEVVLHGDKDDLGQRLRVDISRGRLAAAAKHIRADVHRINVALSEHKVELHIDEDIFVQHFLSRPKGQALTPPNPLHNRVCRVFNHTFDMGGRYYKHWAQGIPRDLRRFIRIDGLPVMELDYKAIHPSILYCEEGFPIPKEMYMPHSFPKGTRDAGKAIMLSVLNAATEADAIKASRQTIRTKYRTVMKEAPGILKDTWLAWAIEQLREMHAPIAHHFCSGVGTRLQNVDSRIASLVMHTLLDQGIVSMPVHDSFVVAHVHTEALRQAMHDASLAICGAAIPADEKYPLSSQIVLLDEELVTKAYSVMDEVWGVGVETGLPYTLEGLSRNLAIATPQRVSGRCA